MIPLAWSHPAESPSQGGGRLLVSVSVDKSIYLAGEAIGIRLVLVNPTSMEVSIVFGSSYWIDCEILSGNDILYRWSEDKAFAQAYWTLTMTPLEVREYSFVHTDSDYSLSPGVYAIRGWAGGCGENYAALVVVDVLPGLVLRAFPVMLGTGLAAMLVSVAGYALTRRPASKRGRRLSDTETNETTEELVRQPPRGQQ